MRYDDRLLTVLSQPAGDRHDAAVRWRQLVDLIARAGQNGASPAVGRAIEEIRREAPNIGDDLRGASARAVAALPLPLALLEFFASDKLAVCAPVLAAASLDAGQWRSLLALADPETSRFIETLHPELRPGSPTDLTEALVEPPLELTDAHPAETPNEPGVLANELEGSARGPSLHEVVERIERRRRTRLGQDDRQSPQGEGAGRVAAALFRWECGPSGEIAWVEGVVRGPLIGRSIGRPQESEGDRVDQDVVRAFAMRAPFRDAGLTLAGDSPVGGEWKSAVFRPSNRPTVALPAIVESHCAKRRPRRRMRDRSSFWPIRIRCVNWCTRSRRR